MSEPNFISQSKQGFYDEIECYVKDRFSSIRKKMIKKWFDFKDYGINDTLPDGTNITLSGLAFDGSVQELFWRKSYFPQYLDDIFNETLRGILSYSEKNTLNPNSGIIVLEKLCCKYIQALYEEMARIDANLRGQGKPKERIDVEDYVRAHQKEVIDRLTKYKLNKWETVCFFIKKHADNLIKFFKFW